MADNYLEKRMEEYSSQPRTKRTAAAPSFEQLVLKNRSYRGYDPTFVVRKDQLHRIIGLCTRIPSACNRQILRFRPVLADEADKVRPYIRLGGALKNMKLPLPGTEPNAFVVICSTIEKDHYVDIDLGIAAQTMLLMATQMGLGGICIGAFNHEEVKKALELELEPLLILAIGRPAERIELVPIKEQESHDYWRDEEGIHYVPKIQPEDLIIG